MTSTHLQRDSEGEEMVVFSVDFTHQEILVVQDFLAVAVFNDDPERLDAAVHFLLPAEVRRDGQVHLQHGSSDGLYVRLHLYFWKLVY